ncbi:MAG: glutaredoxin domain-containing protein [archaeon]|nr:glutaredoxin domain-containing protein [archaeon]
MNVIIYTIPTSEWCNDLKAWLKKKKISFEERETTEESKWREEVLNKTGQLAVPVIDIDGNVLIGFDEKKLEEAIQKAKA